MSADGNGSGAFTEQKQHLFITGQADRNLPIAF